MPSVRYYNQTAPFWDFIASLEEQGINNNNNRPNVTTDDNNNEEGSRNESEHQHQYSHPWAQGWTGFPWGPMPHRGRHAHHGPPPHHEGPPAPPAEGQEGEAGPSEPRGPPPPFSDNDEEGGPSTGPGRCHGRRRGPGARGGHCGRGRGGFGPFAGGRGRHFHPYAAAGGFGPFAPLAEMFQSQLFGGSEENNKKNKDAEDFTPDIDVFDTPSSFVIHVSLPGAKKEDVGVNWEHEKSELSIAGVVYRPGDEKFLQTLAMDERKVGAFERKVRLGSRANPAQVDVEGIVARLEDGVLRIEVPKIEEEGFVDVKKVDIE